MLNEKVNSVKMLTFKNVSRMLMSLVLVGRHRKFMQS
ncbi:hypothetical protein VC_A0452 [Vibrio cholerae O1 biovar El Tor str. N16961]|uniref:Uncharacterized protein n=1 Tax=Vibrio cholerae serotype O1 (strain ATCC 39315 / El Tor Inaba N16961) TaxID=243277 RepID=Q9KMC0_VIBCH|nr:hypothetical protein VC_A0452 [Vibrio cholerae O1 biovar El Tor str. N16961]